MKRETRRLHRLGEALERARRVLVLTHDNPDPDAIASAWILRRIVRRRFGLRADLGYGGVIGRTENRAMIDVLRVPLRPLIEIDMDLYDAIALVDAQPRTGNTSLPAGRFPTVVFDHHPCRRLTRRVPYYDIREDYGATTTILYEYLLAAGLGPDRRLATAIFHSIRSETQNLGREASRADAKAFLDSFRLVDNVALSRIEQAPLPLGYFAMLDSAIAGTRLYGEIAVTTLDEVDNPDMVAQFADQIVRLEGILWALCIGRFRGDLILSLRTQSRTGNAGKVIREIVGPGGMAGGHDMIAGGKVSGSARTRVRAGRVEEILRKRLLRTLGASGIRGIPLAVAAQKSRVAGRII